MQYGAGGASALLLFHVAKLRKFGFSFPMFAFPVFLVVRPFVAMTCVPQSGDGPVGHGDVADAKDEESDHGLFRPALYLQNGSMHKITIVATKAWPLETRVVADIGQYATDSDRVAECQPCW
jgi:hypothetical protein